MNEEFRSCGDDLYEVSNCGTVRKKRGKVLKQTLLSTGYLQVQMSERKKMAVHRLVALAFCDGFGDGLVVNHINGKRDDNRSENLEWVTPSQNLKHAYENLGIRNPFLGKTSKEHPTSKRIIARSIATGETLEFDCGMDAIRAGIARDSGAVSRCCNGIWKSHNGYTFTFSAERGVSLSDERAAA